MMFSTIPAALADSQLDSLVNIATQARTQVKLQLDRADNVPDNIKTLYEKGNSETELLINSVKQQDIAQSKQHFLSAMKIFKQISITLSSTQAKTVTAPQVMQDKQAPIADINYKASISRMENYIHTLKGLVTKNNISIDFTNLDELIQNAKADIAKGDMISVEKTYDELKTAITETQNLIREETSQKLVDRAKSFANEYIVKIDALISNAKELGISDDDVAKLKQVRESLSTTNDPSQIIVKVQRIITINVDIKDSKNQRAISEANRSTVQADSVKNENVSEKAFTQDQNVKQEQKQRETKTQNTSQIDRLETRLAKLEPSIDDNIQPKFDNAKSLLSKLKTQTSGDIDQRMLKSLDALVREIENYVDFQNAKGDSDSTDQNMPTYSDRTDTKNPTDPDKSNLKPKRPQDQKSQ
ncbi:hypothetical protein QVH35_03065 [Candidatus Nitrosotenuis chungbukensis]|nr:hypothetical protein [Candidatus Nitrosotenuis chungbukensis]WKT58412.1 hypothetical protein QVH35_03065 [Candidatus Nitrosotenuis chungbukensis]